MDSFSAGQRIIKKKSLSLLERGISVKVKEIQKARKIILLIQDSVYMLFHMNLFYSLSNPTEY